ncbi:MAG: FkbM family methyltransferase [Mucilaginibacter sp.]|nr:FkbM family methyltransferase [Mucilaginibacter sp.]
MEKIKRTFGFILSHPLCSRHPVKSIFRFLLWQVQSSFSPSKFFVKQFISPVKFYARKGLTGVTGNIYAGLHEFNDMAFLLHFLNSEDVFFDVGANVGSYTLLASGVCKSNSIAIEPVKSTFDLLNQNIKLNNLQDRVSTINAAAGAVEGTITFTSDQDTTNHVTAENEANDPGTINVPVIAIDSWLTGNSPSLIKIDVEGYETEVLKGMGNTLNLFTLKAIIIELNGSGGRYGYNEEEIHQLLLAKKFKPYTYDPFKRTLTEIASFGNNNTIYCRDEGFIINRLKQGAGIHIMGEVI